MENTTQTTPLADRMLKVLAGAITRVRQDDVSDDDLRTLIDTTTRDLRAEASTQARPDTLLAVDALAYELRADLDKRRELARRNGGVAGVRIGFGHVDETINGAEPGKLLMLAAAPGTGKTTFCLQAAANVAQSGHVALYISLENDALDLARKTVCRLGDISYSAALKGKVNPDVWNHAVTRLDTLRGRLIVCAPRDKMPDLDELVEGVIERTGERPALICVDYLQAYLKRMGNTPGDTADVRERLDRFTPALRALGERHDAAVLAINSQNRAGQQAGGMSSLKESGDLEYGADVVMTLNRWSGRKEGDVPPVVVPSGHTLLELKVEKNRQGLTGAGAQLLMLKGDRCAVTEVERHG